MPLVLVSTHIELSSIGEHGSENEDLETLLVVPQILLLGEAHSKMRSSHPFGKLEIHDARANDSSLATGANDSSKCTPST